MFYIKRKPAYPGEILNEEFLKPLEISQTALAEALEISFRTVNELVNEKRNLSSELAVKLAKYFGTSPELWFNLKNQYDIYKISKLLSRELSKIKPITG